VPVLKPASSCPAAIRAIDRVTGCDPLRFTDMRLAGSLLALVFVAACSQTPAGAGRPSASPPNRGPSASATAAPPAASTSPLTQLPVTNLNFSCRLPFVRDIGGGRWQDGFLDLPSGAFSADPTAPAQPGYYDRAVSRWVPVGRQAVASDGRHYALMTGGNPSTTPGPPRLHVVDAATGADNVIDLGLPEQQPYGVEDYATDGVYVASSWEGVANGLWRVDPANGTVTDLGKQDHFTDDGTGHAWVSTFDPRDPNPARSALSGLPLANEVVRRELKTGAVEVWFYHPGFNVALQAAFVGGGLLVWVEPNGGLHEYWLVTAPGTSTLVAHIDYGGSSMADTRGIWMGGNNGLYLFTRAGGVARVSDLAGDPANGCINA
jgi:hypothetical protein